MMAWIKKLLRIPVGESMPKKAERHEVDDFTRVGLEIVEQLTLLQHDADVGNVLPGLEMIAMGQAASLATEAIQAKDVEWAQDSLDVMRKLRAKFIDRRAREQMAFIIEQEGRNG
jgi:hypothetical protein